jgi:hypothetical protein
MAKKCNNCDLEITEGSFKYCPACGVKLVEQKEVKDLTMPELVAIIQRQIDKSRDYNKQNTKWSDDELQSLKQMDAKGWPSYSIAKSLNRSINGVDKQLWLLKKQREETNTKL